MVLIQMNWIDGYLVFSCVIVKIHRNKFLKQEYMMIILWADFRSCRFCGGRCNDKFARTLSEFPLLYSRKSFVLAPLEVNSGFAALFHFS